MATYLLGVLTPVALFLLYAIGEWAFHRVSDWWKHYRPGFKHHVEDRIGVAAGLVMARRFLHVRLPGGVIIAYRSLVGAEHRDEGRDLRTHLMEDEYVLRSALRTAVAECQRATEKGETP